MASELAEWLSGEIDKAWADYRALRISEQLRDIRVGVVWDRVKREGLYSDVVEIRLEQLPERWGPFVRGRAARRREVGAGSE